MKSNKASVNPGNKLYNTEYILEDSNKIEDDSERQNKVPAKSNSDSEDDLENKDLEKRISEATK